MPKHHKYAPLEKDAPDIEATASASEPVLETAKDAEPDSNEREATIDEWQGALEIAVKQRDEYLSLAQRTQADFENYRRRNASVAKDARDDGVREAVMAMLPTMDNLERALAANEDAESPIAQGVSMIRAQMLTAMKGLGCEEVNPLGEKFDPELHNAVLRADPSEGEPGTICEVMQKGFSLRGRMLRYAMVKVVAE